MIGEMRSLAIRKFFSENYEIPLQITLYWALHIYFMIYVHLVAN